MFHIFRLNTETAAFQLCDIHDETLKQMVESMSENLGDRCGVYEPVPFCLISSLHTTLVKTTDGWCTFRALEEIKIILCHKFLQLPQGHVAMEEEYEAPLNKFPSMKC